MMSLKLIVQQEYFLGSECWMTDLSFLMGAEFAANVGFSQNSLP
jgi:hypothetical protein